MAVNVCIVVIGYNRKDSILRNLNQLNRCSYPHPVDLYISIDNSGVNAHVLEAVTAFEWKHGEKTVIPHEQRLGLKAHVLQCGDIVNLKAYDGIIMLEDDIFVAPNFYNYVSSTIEYFGDAENIAGISLYKHDWNIDAKYPFIPLYEGYDVYFMQYAQSWGQAWSRKMWNDFRAWLKDNEAWDLNDSRVPRNVLNWGEKSWLKYNIKYCIATNKYFVYPHQSLSTNFSEAGEHNAMRSVVMQRALSAAAEQTYRFCAPQETRARYDAFFESNYLAEQMKDTTIDFYARKAESERYLLSMEKKPFKMVKSYSLQLKPIELNVLYELPGDELYLYDTAEKVQADERATLKRLNYYWFPFNLMDVIKFSFGTLYSKLKRRLIKK